MRSADSPTAEAGSAPVRDADVLIVGGGPAGLTAAMLLAGMGVDVRLIERRRETMRLPRAHLLNQRTMEIFSSLGIGEQIYQLSPPEDRWHRVGWYTSLAGDRPGHGRLIGSVPAWGGGGDAQRYTDASPARYANVPQMRLDPLLRRNAMRLCPGRIHFGQELTELSQPGQRPILTVRDTDSGESYQVSGRYVIAADGGRLSAEKLGIQLAGPTQLLDMVTLHVSADLSEWITDEETLLYYFIRPEEHGTFQGSICAMGPDDWGRHSTEWAFHQAYGWGDPAARDVSRVVQRNRDMLGIPDLDFTVHAVSHWEFEGVTAEQFRHGNVFLVGNAAHRHPPSGGLGLNTAVQDVHNLAWKLAMVLRGQAGGGLLDTYAAEREPVAAFNVAHSLHNFTGHRRIADALGLRPDQPTGEGWDEIGVWLGDDAQGQARKKAVAAAVESSSDDYGQLNVELGFVYSSTSAVLGAKAEDPDQPRSLRDYQPSTDPGHHLPHAWLSAESGTVSTLNTFPETSFALFVTGDEERRWSQTAVAVGKEFGVDLRVVSIGGGGAFLDVDGVWESVRGTDPSGAVLVRPDRHVAWRSSALPADPDGALGAALAVILDRGKGSVRVTGASDTG